MRPVHKPNSLITTVNGVRTLKTTVEESRAIRQQHLQARFRGRGGVFVQSQTNPLVDILMARAVNGESPGKSRNRKLGSKANPQATQPRKLSNNAKTRARGRTKVGINEAERPAETGDEPGALEEGDKDYCNKEPVAKPQRTIRAGKSKPKADCNAEIKVPVLKPDEDLLNDRPIPIVDNSTADLPSKTAKSVEICAVPYDEEAESDHTQNGYKGQATKRRTTKVSNSQQTRRLSSRLLRKGIKPKCYLELSDDDESPAALLTCVKDAAPYRRGVVQSHIVKEVAEPFSSGMPCPKANRSKGPPRSYPSHADKGEEDAVASKHSAPTKANKEVNPVTLDVGSKTRIRKLMVKNLPERSLQVMGTGNDDDKDVSPIPARGDSRTARKNVRKDVPDGEDDALVPKAETSKKTKRQQRPPDLNAEEAKPPPSKRRRSTNEVPNGVKDMSESNDGSDVATTARRKKAPNGQSRGAASKAASKGRAGASRAAKTVGAAQSFEQETKPRAKGGPPPQAPFHVDARPTGYDSEPDPLDLLS